MFLFCFLLGALAGRRLRVDLLSDLFTVVFSSANIGDSLAIKTFLDLAGEIASRGLIFASDLKINEKGLKNQLFISGQKILIM